MLGTRERVLSPAEQKSLAEFLRLLVSIRDEGGHDVAEIFRPRLIALLLRFVRVVFPQIAGRSERSAEPEVRIRMFSAPQYGLGAERARNPHRRMRFLKG